MNYEIDEDDFQEPFEVRLCENYDPDRPHINVYNGLIDSLLFDGLDKLLAIYFMYFSDTSEINCVNTSTISINEICKITTMSKPTVCKHIKRLEEKGVLIKQKNNTCNNKRTANTYKLLNYISVWDCKTLEELKKETNKIKSEVLNNG